MEFFSPLARIIMENLGESVATFSIVIVGIFWKQGRVWWRERDMRKFERGINQNVRLRELLSELRVPYHADRVCLYQFFNGNYYLAGGSIMRCFLTHFVTKAGVSNPPVGQMIPTTQMVMTLKSLQDKATAAIAADTFIDDNFADGLFVETGATRVFATAVRDPRKNWIGILCICWLNDPGIQDDGPLLEYSRLIGAFLSQKI
jgi:hypothetical protein